MRLMAHTDGVRFANEPTISYVGIHIQFYKNVIKIMGIINNYEM